MLHLANQGVTINEFTMSMRSRKGCGQVVLPGLSRLSATQQPWRHPALSRILGLQPDNTHSLVAADSSALYVEMMGGSEKILARGRELHDEGKYLLAQEISTSWCRPNRRTRWPSDLLADVFEQLGYQQENPGLRNSYLAAAYELRSGIPQGGAVDSSSPDVIRAMSTELFLNFLGIRMDSRKAEGMRFTINLITADNGEKIRGPAGECHAHQH